MSRIRVFAPFRVVFLSVVCVVVAGLGCDPEVEGDAGHSDAGHSDADQWDDGPEDAADTGGDTERAAPHSTPEEACPSGVFAGGEGFEGQGICRAESPMLSDWDCPDGWQSEPAWGGESFGEFLPAQVTGYGICRVPETPEDCAAGFMAVPGESQCVQQGSACADAGDGWRQEQDIRQRADGFDGRIFYVAPDAQAGAAGTRAEPAPLAEALSDASDGDIVALSAGEFSGGVTLHADIALVGACVSATTIRTASEPGESTQTGLSLSQSGGALVADLTVNGGEPGVSVVEPSGMNRFEGVRIEAAEFEGISVQGGPGGVSAREVVVTGTESRSDDGAAGYGVHVSDGAKLDFARGWLEQNRAVGLLIQGGQTRVDLVDAGIVGTGHQAADGSFGAGVVAGEGAELSLERVVVRDNRFTGVMVEGGGTTASLTDVAIEATRAQQADDRHGQGMTVTGGASAEIRRARFDANRTIGLAVRGEQSSLTASQVVLRGTQPEVADGSGGIGVQVDGGAALYLEEAWVDDNRTAGLVALDDDTDVELHDALVTRTQADEDGARGFGVHADGGATLRVRRAHLHQNRVVGIMGFGAGTSMQLTDVTVTDTQPQAADDAVGSGILVHDGAGLTIERGWLQHNRASGLWIHGEGTRSTSSDIVVIDTQPQLSDDKYGEGIVMQKNSEIDLTRAWLSANHHLGLAAWDGSHGRCADLVISDTVVGTLGFGDGAFLLQQSDIEFIRTAVRNNERHGIVVSNAAASLTDSLITRNKVGLVRQEETEIVVHDSRIRDNEQAEERCELLCYDEPSTSEPVDALPSTD
ncbi:MAG: hypothetical protein ACLFVJ_17190 [Persicimonas sp.]